jgi:hypothetical protein
MVRWVALVLVLLVGCSDLREFRGDWAGPRVGDAEALKLHVGDVTARLTIDAISEHSLEGRLEIPMLLPATQITSLAGAEADVLADLSFTGGPVRVYLAFAPVPDGLGDALVMIALYDDRRIEVRLMRGGAMPLYGIFALSESRT